VIRHLPFFLIVAACRMNRHQQDVIDSLRQKTLLLFEQIAAKPKR
jgi:hypothetical protein